MANLSTTENCVIVELFTVLMCKLTRSKILSGSLDAEKSGLVVRLTILGRLCAGATSFLISSGLASVYRRHDMGCVILLSAPTEMGTQYALCSASAMK